MRAPNETEEKGILLLIGVAAVAYLGYELLQIFNFFGDEYVKSFYNEANQYGTNTVVTQGAERSGSVGRQADINADPYIWGTSI